MTKKKSTTQKVLKALLVMLNREGNEEGLTAKEVWVGLESIAALKSELYDERGQRRNNILTGLTTRIKQGKVAGVRVIRDNNKLVYIAVRDELEFLRVITQSYLQQVSEVNLDSDNYTEDERVAIKHFNMIKNYLEKFLELTNEIAQLPLKD